MARFDSTWQQIATTFKNEPGKLLLESINEPVFNNATDAQKTQYLNELNTSFHSVVRKSGGKNKDRLLMLPTQAGSADPAPHGRPVQRRSTRCTTATWSPPCTTTASGRSV